MRHEFFAPFTKRPLTAGLLVCISITMCWLGIVLLHTHLPPDIPGQPKLYEGPRTFAPLHVWGWLFFISGVIKMLRITLLDHLKTSFLLHTISMTIALAWALSFDLGPMSTAQPNYTFFAAIVCIGPFVAPIVDWSIRYNGFILIPKPGGKHSLEDYPETAFSRELKKLHATDSVDLTSSHSTKSEGDVPIDD